MRRKPKTRPTDAELYILRVLWNRGPSTVKAVHQELAQLSDVGYTTILKTLQIMTDKGLVLRDESARAHIYTARESEDVMQRHLVRDLLDRAFEGSAQKLVLQALANTPASEKELAEIRKLLDNLSGEDDDCD